MDNEPTLDDLGLGYDGHSIPAKPAKKCHICGAETESFAKECPDCIAIRQTSSTATTSPRRTHREPIAKPKGNQLNLAIGVACCVLATGCLLAFFGGAKANAVVTDVKIRQIDNPSNKRIQVVQVAWRNTGGKPVRTVDADIVAFDAIGNVIHRANYTIYAVSGDNPGVLPGETHVPEAGVGYSLPGWVGSPAYTPAVRAEAAITFASEEPGF
jgi:hypothetical protein